MQAVKPVWGLNPFWNRIIEKVPPPAGDPDAPLQALIFDSVFNSFRGVIAYFKIMNGNQDKRFGEVCSYRKQYNADEIGVLKLGMVPARYAGRRRCGLYYVGHKNS
jgi:GTP-binding protein LepA